MTSARLLLAVVALLAGLWGPQQPPGPAIPTRAADAWPGP
jgi:hypothetical protein